MTREIYEALGLSGVEVAVSTRPEKWSGEVADWDAAERRLQAAVERAGQRCGIKPGGAAFYGPKVEVDLRDVLGRPWTLATLQIDCAMPGRFGLRYVGRDNAPHQPAMLHRAVLGSLERFIALYIETTAGDFPLWLAPVQVRVLPIAERHLAWAREVQARLRAAGVRAELDERGDTLGLKIREAELNKVPVMFVVGDQEQAARSVMPRLRGLAQLRYPEKVAQPLDEAVGGLVEAIEQRRIARPNPEEVA
jgi:threonyl-tRNA synthetase